MSSMINTASTTSGRQHKPGKLSRFLAFLFRKKLKGQKARCSSVVDISQPSNFVHASSIFHSQSALNEAVKFDANGSNRTNENEYQIRSNGNGSSTKVPPSIHNNAAVGGTLPRLNFNKRYRAPDPPKSATKSDFNQHCDFDNVHQLATLPLQSSFKKPTAPNPSGASADESKVRGVINPLDIGISTCSPSPTDVFSPGIESLQESNGSGSGAASSGVPSSLVAAAVASSPSASSDGKPDSALASGSSVRSCDTAPVHYAASPAALIVSSTADTTPSLDIMRSSACHNRTDSACHHRESAILGDCPLHSANISVVNANSTVASVTLNPDCKPTESIESAPKAAMNKSSREPDGLSEQYKASSIAACSHVHNEFDPTKKSFSSTVGEQSTQPRVNVRSTSGVTSNRAGGSIGTSDGQAKRANIFTPRPFVPFKSTPATSNKEPEQKLQQQKQSAVASNAAMTFPSFSTEEKNVTASNKVPNSIQKKEIEHPAITPGCIVVKQKSSTVAARESPSVAPNVVTLKQSSLSKIPQQIPPPPPPAPTLPSSPNQARKVPPSLLVRDRQEKQPDTITNRLSSTLPTEDASTLKPRRPHTTIVPELNPRDEMLLAIRNGEALARLRKAPSKQQKQSPALPNNSSILST